MARLFHKNCKIHGISWHSDSGCRECAKESKEETEEKFREQWNALTTEEKLNFLFTQISGIEP